MATHYRRFRDISVSERLLDSLFLLTIGIGYLFAMVHVYYSHHNRDGKPGLSVEDIRIAYYGSQENTRLAAAINGPMEPNLKSAADKKTIISWLETGKLEDKFKTTVAPILNRDCIFCHNPETNPSLPDLTNYQGVMEVSLAKGASLPALVRVSHIHLFGIAFILFFTLFTYGVIVTEINAKEKVTEQSAPVEVVVETSKGSFTLQLNPEKAPQTVANFLTYVNEGFYSNTLFHRVIPRFVVQGGGYEKGM